jgi:predicted nuclease with RNAse H fold
MQEVRVVGFDPGGKRAFGWAVLMFSNGRLSQMSTGTCSGSSQAVLAANSMCPSPPFGVAIDAPLFWTVEGDRQADAVVRKMVCAAGGSSGTVSHVNSLRGACLVQGVLVARLAAETWPHAQISEAHPKALLKVSRAARLFAETIASQTQSEHERDSALAAFTAFQLVSGSNGWKDLAKSESKPYFTIGKPVAYWFPGQRD